MSDPLTTDSLTIYSIRSSVADPANDEFDKVVDAARFASADEQHDFAGDDDSAGRPWSARLYVWHGQPKPPSWVAFLGQGVGEDLTVPDSSQSSALLVVKFFFRRDRFYAIPFGSGGRFQIKRGAVEAGYGLRTALNALYEGDRSSETLTPAPRIRQVESKTVAANTMRTMRQANRTTDFAEFDLDADCDQLAAVVGSPANVDWARRVRGTDSLRVARKTTFAGIGALCRDIASMREKRDYERRFDFVDRFQGITDPTTIADLEGRLQLSLRADPGAWNLAAPSIQHYDEIARFVVNVPGHDPVELLDLSLDAVVAQVSVEDIAGQLSGIRVDSIDGDGKVVEQWQLGAGLDGQLVVQDDDGNERTFLREGGLFYAIEASYLRQLDKDINDIPISGVALPDSVKELVDGELKEMTEGDYNELAAQPADRLMLDRRTVTIPGKTSPIEICDVLTLDRKLIHVKRKFGSSSLSHLFGQGYVASELLVDSRPFRAEVRTAIGNDDPQFRDLFSEGGLVASDWEVVYAIVGPWGAATPAERLPFFSKINLRNHARGLRRMGFDVTISKIPVVDPV